MEVYYGKYIDKIVHIYVNGMAFRGPKVFLLLIYFVITLIHFLRCAAIYSIVCCQAAQSSEKGVHIVLGHNLTCFFAKQGFKIKSTKVLQSSGPLRVKNWV